jgi:hypothetical protein
MSNKAQPDKKLKGDVLEKKNDMDFFSESDVQSIKNREYQDPW